MLEITKISDRVIEVGIDPIYNNDYEDCYATRFSIDEVKTMLACLGLDYDKNQELVAEQNEQIHMLRCVLSSLLSIVDEELIRDCDSQYAEMVYVQAEEALVATGRKSNG